MIEDASSRELIRTLRTGICNEKDVMPESLAWQTYLELQRRGEPKVGGMFIKTIKSLHDRRSMAGSTLCCTDKHTDEHRLSDDKFLGELWKAYKKCIKNNRTGPASLLLRDIEERVSTSLV